MLAEGYGSFYSYKKWETAYFGEEITFIGFPSNNGGSNAYASPSDYFAIAKNAKDIVSIISFFIALTPVYFNCVTNPPNILL